MADIREYRKATYCNFGPRVIGCRHAFLGQCQYCARGFCAKHGEQFDEIQEVCFRQECQAKKKDLEDYHAHQRKAQTRNQNGLCAEPTCDAAHHTHCERCTAHYCEIHLREEIVSVRQHLGRELKVQRLCLHCIVRMRLWVEN